MVFCLNGKRRLSINQAIKRSTKVSGTITIIHLPNPIPISIPLGSLRNLRAIALGGVPIGVPMPPMLAPTGMARANPILPLPSAGKALSTGARKVSIIAAVAVLLINIEKTAVTRINPRSTFSDFVPNGSNITLASLTSSPDLVAAIAMMKPPINNMIVGSAKQWRMSVLLTRLVILSPSEPDWKNHKALLDAQNNRRTTTTSEVVHAGTASKSHIRAANTKIARTRCSTGVKPGKPYNSEGAIQKKSGIAMAKKILTALIPTGLRSLRCSFFQR